MRYPDQSLIGDLNDNFLAKTSGSITVTLTTSSIDENATTYDLLPVVINKPPVIVSPISEASTPSIKPYATADATGQSMYLFPDGNVKVNIGAKIKLSIGVEQPDVFNIENGIPTILPPKSGLNYIWRKDGQIVTSTYNNSLQSVVNVNTNTIEFDNIQPASAGTYTCEITNDIGTTVSEPITLEVLNLDFDTLFYRNLIKNPYGADGTNEWNTNNSDLTTRNFTKIPSQDLIKPNRVDLFGYTIDTMHPRPYQIDMGVVKGFDMTNQFLSNNPTYFSRTRYKFEKRGGSYLVRAYQDIDLTDIIPLIKGGVYGVEGVRAMFSCYIGNGISQFVPVNDIIDPTLRNNPSNYILSEPRLSIENFLTAGPATGIYEKAYVTIEEYDNETRLPSTLYFGDNFKITQSDRITLIDPWHKRTSKYWNKKYYVNDIYGLGETSTGDGRDTVLFTAEELYPNPEYRYTYGQFAEFNKIIFDKLHPNTTKVRITLNFQTWDNRIFETWKGGYEQSEEIFEALSWEMPFQKNKFSRYPGLWNDSVVWQILRESGSVGKTYPEVIPAAQDPRVMITALNFTLLPVLTQQKDTTDYYTRITLAQNDTPVSTIPSGLTFGRQYDPYGVGTREISITFKGYSEDQPTLDKQGYLGTRDRIEIRVKQKQPVVGDPNPTPINYDITPNSLLPFAPQSRVSYEAATDFTVASEESSYFYDYVRYRTLPQYAITSGSSGVIGGIVANITTAIQQANYRNTSNALNLTGWAVYNMGINRAPSSDNDIAGVWSNKVRYVVYLAPTTTRVINNSNVVETTLRSTRINGSPNDRQILQTYYLDIDFSDSNNTKVILSRPDNLYPAGFGSISIELPHTIDPYGVLVCTLPSDLVFAPMTQGGLGYERTSDNIFTVSAGVVDCVRALHSNLGDFSLVPLTQNTYYTQRVGEVFKIINQIKATRDFSGIPDGNINTLLEFSSSLNDYAYNSAVLFNESKYMNYSQAISSQFVIDITNSTFVSGSTNQTTIPPHLLDIKAPGQTIEFLGVRPANPTQGSGSPTSGRDSNGFRYRVVYTPVQDSAEDNYKDGSVD